MAKYLGGVAVSGYIAPSDTLDVYATHKAQFGQGGYRTAIDIAARDAITPLRREEGMVVYVLADKKEYRLEGGTANTNWVEIIASTGTGTSKQNYLIFNDITERETYTTTSPDAAVGQLCYVIGEDKEYRLKGGTTNANWALVDNSVVGTSNSNYQIVSTLNDINTFPLVDRTIGMIFYTINTDKEYRLIGGVDNANLVELSTTGDTINNINNSYFNTFGCLNVSSIQQVILDGIKDSTLGGTNYTDPTTNTPIPSGSDSNTFTFVINKTDYWINDWVYFIGTTSIDTTKTNEVFIELTHRGSTELINVNQMLDGSLTLPDVEIFGTKTRWYGYFRKSTTGRIDIKAYETQNGNTAFNINKSVYLFSPNFGILDGTSITPLDVICDGLNFFDKVYSFKVLPNTSLVVTLARVQVTSKGIDIVNYMSITQTMKPITSDSDFVIDKDIFKNTIIDGSYALLVTGTDAGISIPPYFYGPFTFKKFG